MHARLAFLDVDFSNRQAIERLANRAEEIMRQQKGLVSVTMLIDEENGRAGDLSVWETKEDLDAWVNKDVPELREMAAPLMTGGMTREFFEVYDPKG